MTLLTLRQLDRTRQPGSARVGAGWYAAMTGAKSPGSVIDITFDEVQAMGGRDPRSQNNFCAGTVVGGFTP